MVTPLNFTLGPKGRTAFKTISTTDSKVVVAKRFEWYLHRISRNLETFIVRMTEVRAKKGPVQRNISSILTLVVLILKN